jgi:hypothetical protein
MPSKLFLAAIDVRTGDERYLTFRLVRDATTLQEARELVSSTMHESLTPLRMAPETFVDPKGYPAYTIDYVAEIEALSDLPRFIPPL